VGGKHTAASPRGQNGCVPSDRTQLTIGILSALPEELGSLPTLSTASRRVQGLDLQQLTIGRHPAICTTSGVGKVHAAQAATLLIEAGAQHLLIVGTCGGLRRSLRVGTMVHCTTAFQSDLAVRDGRSSEADERWRATWRKIVPGPEGWFLTADRPVLTPWRRMRLARAFSGPCVADMETAAAGRVADAAGITFSALRAVTDGAGISSSLSFRKNFLEQAPRAANSVSELLDHVDLA
jgi:adenosylhomocysteine nucleosidase